MVIIRICNVGIPACHFTPPEISHILRIEVTQPIAGDYSLSLPIPS